MKKVCPGRGIIKRFLANTVENSFADFLTYNTENTITLWKIRSTTNAGDTVIQIELIDDVMLEVPPGHISFHENYIALSYGVALVTLKVSCKKRRHYTVEMFKHTKDENHRKCITQVCHITSTRSGTILMVEIWKLFGRNPGKIGKTDFDHPLEPYPIYTSEDENFSDTYMHVI